MIHAIIESMKVTAIIAEYNPLHKGHEYLIERARSLSGADRILVLMSGDFVQRGEPAITDKYSRTKVALLSGADLVLELPTPFATASADWFARGAVSILKSLGCVDSICFGSEEDDAGLLNKIASVTLSESPDYKNILDEGLRSGLSYPAARAKAIAGLYSDKLNISHEILSNILVQPNNTLALSYMRAALNCQYYVNFIPVKRIGSGYNSTDKGALSSLSVRNVIYSGDPCDLKDQLPDGAYELLTGDIKGNCLLFHDDISALILQKIREKLFLSAKQLVPPYHGNIERITASELMEYEDVSEPLSYKLINYVNQVSTVTELIRKCKSKDMTYAHISRALIHILLELKHDLYLPNKNNSCYARVLGFRKDSADLLTLIKERSDIPLISKSADADLLVADARAHDILLHDFYAANLYEQLRALKSGRPFTAEQSKQIVTL